MHLELVIFTPSRSYLQLALELGPLLPPGLWLKTEQVSPEGALITFDSTSLRKEVSPGLGYQSPPSHSVLTYIRTPDTGLLGIGP